MNANKVFVTNGGIADICLMFVRTNTGAGRKEISVVAAERGTPGFVVGDLEALCGMRANPVSSIRLYDCRIPSTNLLGKEGQGLRIGLAALDTGRMGIAAQSTGISQGALDETLRYARQRRQFRVPIERHQAVQMMIADMATFVDASRLMTHRCSSLSGYGTAFFPGIGHGKALCLRGILQGDRYGGSNPRGVWLFPNRIRWSVIIEMQG